MRLRYILIVLSYIIVYSCSLSYSGDDSELAVSQTKATLSFLSNSIQDVNFYIFDNEGQLFYHDYYPDPSTAQTEVYLFQGNQYTAYALANYHSSLYISSASSLESFRLSIDASPSLIDEPILSGKYGPFVAAANNTIQFEMERLYAQIKVNFDFSHMTECSSFEVKSVALRNTPKYTTPFADFKAKTIDEISPDGYAISSCGINKENVSDTITLYSPENLQGNLLPNNTIQSGKVLSNLAQASLCTYLEIQAEYRSDTRSGTVIYRFYPGSDAVSNFDIHHNTSYLITIQPIGDGLNDINWRIDTQNIEPFITSISFPQNGYYLENEGASLEIIPILSPEDASVNNIIWSSQHPDKISVTQEGVITGLSSGSSYIYLESKDDIHLKDSVLCMCDKTYAQISKYNLSLSGIITATNLIPSDYCLKISTIYPFACEFHYISSTQVRVDIIRTDKLQLGSRIYISCFIVPSDMEIANNENPTNNKYYVGSVHFYSIK